MSGSPDIPEIHPLPTPHFCIWFRPCSQWTWEWRRPSSTAFCHPPPDTHPTSLPRGSLAGKQCVQEDRVDQPFLSPSIMFYIHSLEGHCRLSQRSEQAGIQ